MDTDLQDQRSPQRRFIEVQMAHADLDALIDQATQGQGGLDELLLRRLKKRRLALRDEMTRLQWLLQPKEPA